MNPIQDYAEGVAAKLLGIPKVDVSGAVAKGAGVAGIDPATLMALIELIMSFVMQMIDKCRQPDPAVREAIKRPSLWNRVQLRYAVRSGLDCCADLERRWRYRVGEITSIMLDLASQADDDTIDAAITQVRWAQQAD